MFSIFKKLISIRFNLVLVYLVSLKKKPVTMQNFYCNFQYNIIFVIINLIIFLPAFKVKIIL